MSPQAAKDLSAADEAVLARAVLAGSARVERLVLPSGCVLWIKRIEKLGFLLRLQKGDPAATFAAEFAAIRALHAKGHPVPKIVASGQGYMVLTDGGPNLGRLVATRSLSDDEARLAFMAIGHAIAALHREGFAHGRPVLRDFCWADGRLTMIDLERFAVRPRRPRTQAIDLVIFTQGWFARRGASDNHAGLLDIAIDAYRSSGAPHAVWQELGVLVRWLGRLLWLPRLALRLRPGWREMQAAVWTIEYLRGRLARG